MYSTQGNSNEISSLKLAAMLLGFVLAFISSSSEARAYRCTDANGNVSYLQSPCAAGQTGARVHGIGSTVAVDREACATVRAFATASFDKLKRGTEPSLQIDQYGGPSYINKITLNVINFVSGFRLNKDLQAMKVGGMAYSKCVNGGFGKIQTSDLPPEILPPDIPESEFPVPMPLSPGSAPVNQQLNRNNVVDNQRQQLCQNYEQQLETLNRSMRKGYDADTGQQIRQQRQQIETLLQTYCRK